MNAVLRNKTDMHIESSQQINVGRRKTTNVGQRDTFRVQKDFNDV